MTLRVRDSYFDFVEASHPGLGVPLSSNEAESVTASQAAYRYVLQNAEAGLS